MSSPPIHSWPPASGSCLHIPTYSTQISLTQPPRTFNTSNDFLLLERVFSYISEHMFFISHRLFLLNFPLLIAFLCLTSKYWGSPPLFLLTLPTLLQTPSISVKFKPCLLVSVTQTFPLISASYFTSAFYTVILCIQLRTLWLCQNMSPPLSTPSLASQQNITAIYLSTEANPRIHSWILFFPL